MISTGLLSCPCQLGHSVSVRWVTSAAGSEHRRRYPGRVTVPRSAQLRGPKGKGAVMHKSDWRHSFFIGFAVWLLGGGLAIADLPVPSSRSLSNQCRGLLPEQIGEPRARSVAAPSLFWGCPNPTSSRSGILAFGIESTEPSEFFHYWLYDSRDESQVGSLDTGGRISGFYPPTDTFQQTRTRYVPGEIPTPNPTVESWTDRGEPIDRYQLDPELRDSNRSTYQAAPDLIEGGVFLVYLRIRDGIGWQLAAWLR
jgi:hypothetical protein